MSIMSGHFPGHLHAVEQLLVPELKKQPSSCETDLTSLESTDVEPVALLEIPTSDTTTLPVVYSDDAAPCDAPVFYRFKQRQLIRYEKISENNTWFMVLASEKVGVHDYEKKQIDIESYPSLRNFLIQKNSITDEDKGEFNKLVAAREREYLAFRDYMQIEIIFYGLINALCRNKFNGLKPANSQAKKELLDNALNAGLLLYYLYERQLNLRRDATGKLLTEINAIVVEQFRIEHPEYANSSVSDIENQQEYSNFYNGLIPKWVTVAEKNKEENQKIIMALHFDWLIWKIRTSWFPAYANLLRLWIVRTYRELALLATFVAVLSQSSAGLGWFVNTARFDILSMAFYAPRLIINLCLLFVRVVENPLMSEEEKLLGWRARFETHGKILAFQIGNDLVWLLIDTLVFCMTFFAPPQWKMVVIVTLYIFDVFNCWWSLKEELRNCQKATQDLHWGEGQQNPYDVTAWQLLANYFKEYFYKIMSAVFLCCLNEQRTALPNVAIYTKFDCESDAQYLYRVGAMDFCNERLRVQLNRFLMSLVLLIFMVPLGIPPTPAKVQAFFAVVPFTVNVYAIGLAWSGASSASVNRYSFAKEEQKNARIAEAHMNPIPGIG